MKGSHRGSLILRLKQRASVLLGLASVAWLALSNAGVMTAYASPIIGGTNIFTLVTPAVYCGTAPAGCPSGLQAAEANFLNNSNQTFLGIVLWVVRDSAGQTVAYTSATIDVAAGQNSTAYPTLVGVVAGSYNSAIFVVSSAGVALSTSSSLSFTLTT